MQKLRSMQKKNQNKLIALQTNQCTELVPAPTMGHTFLSYLPAKTNWSSHCRANCLQLRLKPATAVPQQTSRECTKTSGQDSTTRRNTKEDYAAYSCQSLHAYTRPGRKPKPPGTHLPVPQKSDQNWTCLHLNHLPSLSSC